MVTDFQTAVVERVLYVNAAPNGRAFTIGLELKDGRKLAIGLLTEEAAKIRDGITRTRFAVSDNVSGGLAAKVDSIHVNADALGRAVLITVGARGATLGRYAIPPDVAAKVGAALQNKAEEVSRTDAVLRKTPRN